MFKIFFHIFFIFFYIFKRFDLNLIHWYKSEIVIRNIRGCISMVPWNLFIYNTDRETRFDTRDIFLFASENHIFFQIRKIYFFTIRLFENETFEFLVTWNYFVPFEHSILYWKMNYKRRKRKCRFDRISSWKFHEYLNQTGFSIILNIHEKKRNLVFNNL